jgi:hypothetical protein
VLNGFKFREMIAMEALFLLDRVHGVCFGLCSLSIGSITESYIITSGAETSYYLYGGTGSALFYYDDKGPDGGTDLLTLRRTNENL